MIICDFFRHFSFIFTFSFHPLEFLGRFIGSFMRLIWSKVGISRYFRNCDQSKSMFKQYKAIGFIWYDPSWSFSSLFRFSFHPRWFTRDIYEAYLVENQIFFRIFGPMSSLNLCLIWPLSTIPINFYKFSTHRGFTWVINKADFVKNQHFIKFSPPWSV